MLNRHARTLKNDRLDINRWKFTEELKHKLKLNKNSLNKTMVLPVERSIIQTDIRLHREHIIVNYSEPEFIFLVSIIQNVRNLKKSR